MSRKLSRLLLLLAIALAVPLQGIAGASAGLCMASAHHQDMGSMDHEQHAGGFSPESSYCPPCVSCCAAVAIAPAAEPPLPSVAPAPPVAPSQHSIAGFLPEQLERPPLSL